MEKQNPIEEVKEGLKYIWLHRKGNEAHAAVSDAIDALYGNKLKPLIMRKYKTGDALTLDISLPPGLAYADIKKKESIFADAVGGTARVDKRGRKVTMQISTNEIKKEYPYAFDPAVHKDSLPIHFGFSAIGPVVRDLTMMPNLIIAGHPGAGKSNFIHTLIMDLLLNKATPVHVSVFDFKRLEYSYLKEHALIVTEIDLARHVFTSMNQHLTRRLDILECAGVVNLHEYIESGHYDLPFIVLIIDELAEMQDEECQTMLNRILRLGRAAGFCVVCATQRPSSTIFKAFGDSKAMFAGTMCFHVRDAINSQMVLDNDHAALIPQIKGRGIFQWDDELEVQTMHLPVSKAKKMLKDIKPVEVMTVVNLESQKRLPPR